jgi:hypothetical protein
MRLNYWRIKVHSIFHIQVIKNVKVVHFNSNKSLGSKNHGLPSKCLQNRYSHTSTYSRDDYNINVICHESKKWKVLFLDFRDCEGRWCFKQPVLSRLLPQFGMSLDKWLILALLYIHNAKCIMKMVLLSTKRLWINASWTCDNSTYFN